MGDPEKELRHLFAEIDIDGEGTIRYNICTCGTRYASFKSAITYYV
jgi:hypothetical protein